MRRDSIIVVVTVITVAGCSDNLAPNLEACKAKATEARVPKQGAIRLRPGVYACPRVACKRRLR
jgi:hypothetical protein